MAKAQELKAVVESIFEDTMNEASGYAWYIHKDNISDGDDVGVSGPRNADSKMVAQAKARKGGETFKMYDDDGEFYYSGYIVGDYDGFEPLDDFGTPNAGATRIHYRDKRTGKWEAI